MVTVTDPTSTFNHIIWSYPCTWPANSIWQSVIDQQPKIRRCNREIDCRCSWWRHRCTQATQSQSWSEETKSKNNWSQTDQYHMKTNSNRNWHHLTAAAAAEGWGCWPHKEEDADRRWMTSPGATIPTPRLDWCDCQTSTGNCDTGLDKLRPMLHRKAAADHMGQQKCSIDGFRFFRIEAKGLKRTTAQFSTPTTALPDWITYCAVAPIRSDSSHPHGGVKWNGGKKVAANSASATSAAASDNDCWAVGLRY